MSMTDDGDGKVLTGNAANVYVDGRTIDPPDGVWDVGEIPAGCSLKKAIRYNSRVSAIHNFFKAKAGNELVEVSHSLSGFEVKLKIPLVMQKNPAERWSLKVRFTHDKQTKSTDLDSKENPVKVLKFDDYYPGKFYEVFIYGVKAIIAKMVG